MKIRRSGSKVYGWNKARIEAINKYDVSGKILDLGCGQGLVISGLQNRGDFYGIDPSFGELKKARTYCFNLTCGVGEYLPFKDNSFDTVICSEVLEHVNDISQCISEMLRVLKKNGKLIISFPSRTLSSRIYLLVSDLKICHKVYHHKDSLPEPEQVINLLIENGGQVKDYRDFFFRLNHTIYGINEA